MYRFSVIDGDKVLGSVNLETSAVIREQGVPFILGADQGNRHVSLGRTWKQLPAYKVLRLIVIDAIAQQFP